MPDPVGSELADPDLDGVVDVRPAVLDEDRLGERPRELDSDHGLEVGAGVELPTDLAVHEPPAMLSEEPVGGDLVVVGQRTPEPAAERAAARVVVDDERRPTTSHHSIELPQPPLTARSEEVGPACMRDVDARVGHGQPMGGSSSYVDVRQGRHSSPCARGEQPVGLDTDDLVSLGREAGEVEAGTAADVEHGRSGPGSDLPHGALDDPVGVDGGVLYLVDMWMVPDVGAGDGTLDRDSHGGGQMRTGPSGVVNVAAMMPGVPLGATHSTSNVPSRCSSGVSSQLATRLGSPAISTFASFT